MPTGRDMIFEILAIDGASEVFKRVGDSAEKAGAKVEASGEATSKGSKFATMALAGLAAGALVVGVKSIKMAADFQTGMNTLVTSAGESPKALGMVGDGIKSISIQTATSTQQLISGMYMIESAGYHGASGLNVLRAAAEGAKSENADLSTVTNALTTVMTDYHIPVQKSTQAMDMLIATTSSGKTHLEDLAAAFPTVGPVAASLHISLAQVGAAMATMTAQGISADNAAMELRASMLSLVNPNKIQISEMQQMGLTSTQVANTLTHKGLSAALNMLADAAGKKFPVGSAEYNRALARMVGTTRGLQVVLALTGKNTDTMSRNVANIGDAMAGAGKKVDGFAVVQRSFNFQLGQLRQVVEVAMISLGQKLIPVVTKFVGILVSAAGPIGSFIGWIANSKPMLAGLVVVIGVLVNMAIASLIDSIYATVTALAAADIASGGLLLAVGAIAAGLVYAYQNFGWFRDTVNGTFTAISVTVGWFVDFVKDHWKILALVVLGPFGPLLVGLVTYWKQITTAISASITWIIDFVKGHWQFLISIVLGPFGVMIVLITRYWKQIGQGLSALYTGVIKPTFSLIATAVKLLIEGWLKQFQLLWTFLWDDFGKKIFQFLTTTVPSWLKTSLNWLVNLFIGPWKGQLQGLWNWVWNNFGGPIKNFFTNTLVGWVRTGMQGVKAAMNLFTSAMVGPVNWVIKYVYDDGIELIWNTIASIFHGPSLPNIPTIGLASGGVVPISPGVTNGPMAIVGEGNPAWPEYVIPTDPKYRDRAASLWASAGGDLQMLAGGGLLGGIGGALGGIGGAIGGAIGSIDNAIGNLVIGELEVAAKAAFGPLNAIMNRMPYAHTSIGQLLIDGVHAGESGLLSLLHKKDQQGGGPVVNAAKSQLGVPYSWGGGGPGGPSYGFAQGASIKGFDCSSLMQYAYWQGAHKSLPRTTYEQVGLGKAIGSQSSLLPGDLVFPFGDISHVMMVVSPGAQGGSGMIEAPHTGAVVHLTSFYGMSGGARRILGYAGGGVLGPGELALVGEAGPELVYAGSSGGAVQPLNGVGGGSFYAEIDIKLDGQVIDRQLVKFQRTGGTSQAMQAEIKRTVLSSARTQ